MTGTDEPNPRGSLDARNTAPADARAVAATAGAAATGASTANLWRAAAARWLRTHAATARDTTLLKCFPRRTATRISTSNCPCQQHTHMAQSRKHTAQTRSATCEQRASPEVRTAGAQVRRADPADLRPTTLEEPSKGGPRHHAPRSGFVGKLLATRAHTARTTRFVLRLTPCPSCPRWTRGCPYHQRAAPGPYGGGADAHTCWEARRRWYDTRHSHPRTHACTNVAAADSACAGCNKGGHTLAWATQRHPGLRPELEFHSQRAVESRDGGGGALPRAPTRARSTLRSSSRSRSAALNVSMAKYLRAARCRTPTAHSASRASKRMRAKKPRACRWITTAACKRTRSTPETTATAPKIKMYKRIIWHTARGGVCGAGGRGVGWVATLQETV